MDYKVNSITLDEPNETKDMLRRDLNEENRMYWNLAAAVRNSLKRYQAQFFVNGGASQFPEQFALLGAIADQKNVHLQCNSDQDKLSLALLGADVPGVDFSDTALAFAQEMSVNGGRDAWFERADICD